MNKLNTFSKPELSPKVKIEYEKFLELFLANYQTNNRSEKTVINYRLDILKFLRWCEENHINSLKELSPTDMSQYLKYLLTNKNSPRELTFRQKFLNFFRPKVKKITPTHPLAIGSLKRHLSSLKNFFNFLIDINELKVSPIRSRLHNIKLKEKDMEHTQHLTPEQFEKLMKVKKSSKEEVILKILYYGGLRIGELTILKLEDFNPQQKTLKLIRKGGDIHYLPLKYFDEIHLLVKFYAHHNGILKGALFHQNRKSVSEKAMYETIKKIIKRAELDNLNLSPHSFRKACATALYFETKDLLYVRDYLNHQDATVTQTYIDSSYLYQRNQHEKNRQTHHLGSSSGSRVSPNSLPFYPSELS
jgi:site-specific recombinase XerD